MFRGHRLPRQKIQKLRNPQALRLPPRRPRIVRLPTRKRREWSGLTLPAKSTTKKASFTAKLNVVNSCLKTTPKKRDIVKQRPRPRRRQNQRQLTPNKNKSLDSRQP